MQKQETSSGGCGVAGVIRSIIVFVIIALGVGICAGIKSCIRGCNPKLAPFKKHLDEYTAAPDSTIVGDAYIKGKIITIDKEKNKVDPLYLKLPKELHATQPEEVGTIVWLEWGEEKDGTYTDGSGAYVYTCQVTIIDKSLRAIIGQRIFRGSSPPAVKTGAGSRYGSKPTNKIIDYLAYLRFVITH